MTESRQSVLVRYNSFQRNNNVHNTADNEIELQDLLADPLPHSSTNQKTGLKKLVKIYLDSNRDAFIILCKLISCM